MTAIGNLNQPFIEGGIKDPYFFNGRLLTAEDLQDHQTAENLHHRQLGRIMGEGIARGMEVGVVSDGTGETTPTLSVTPGLALNRGGQVLELVDTVHLKLVRDDTGVNGSIGVFAPCKTQNPQLVPTGTGVYILVAAPASDYEGKAPMHYLGDTGKLSGCNHKYQKEGVLFRLVPLDITNASIVGEDIGKEVLDLIKSNDAGSRSKLRNLLAHLCLGTETAALFPTDLFNISGSTAALQQYGPLDILRSSGCLKDTDVPLALVLWTDLGLEFADMWSVRRRIHSSFIFPNTPYPVTDRRTAELEAGFYQFQDQINSLYPSRQAKRNEFYSSVNAFEYFRYLPSVGIVPWDGSEYGEEKMARGYDDIMFFKSLYPMFPMPITGAKLRALLNASFSYDPVDLEKEMQNPVVLLYVMENMRAAESEGARPYLVFAAGYISFKWEDGYIVY